MKNESIEPKILAPIRMLQVLQEYSDENHLLTYADIIDKMDKGYNLVVERKTIQRNLINLQNAGYDIIITRRGCYLAEREFENSELRLLIDSVLFSKHISTKYARDLIEKLQKLGNKYFRNTLHAVYNINQTYHAKSPELFNVIDAIGCAINNDKQISFNYNEYKLDKTLHPVFEKKAVVNPFQLIASDNHYYLVGSYKGTANFVNFRLEKITDIEVLDFSREDGKNGDKKYFDLKEYVNSHPYMYCGKAEKVKLKINPNIVGEIIDVFGDDFRVETLDENEATISLKANLQGVFDWAMKMGRYVEVVSPQELRDKIRESVTVMEHKYSQNEDDIFSKAIMSAKNQKGYATFSNFDLSKRIVDIIKYDYKSLYLKNTNLENIDFFKNYKSLKQLFVIKNQIKDFSVLSELTEINELNLSETKVEDISFLNNLANITRLTLISNPIKDYTPIYSLRNLQYFCVDYNTATTLDLEKISKNNSKVVIKVENPCVVETVDNYKYNQTLMAKKIGENKYELTRINDDEKTYSTEIVSSTDKVEKNYDLFMMALRYKGYTKITKEEIGEKKLVKNEPFKITKEMIGFLSRQIDDGFTSVSQLQKAMQVGYGVAARIIDWMLEYKYIEQTTQTGKYNYVITKEEFLRKFR